MTSTCQRGAFCLQLQAPVPGRWRQSPSHTAHPILHTVHCTTHTAYCTPHNPYGTLYTTHCTPHTAHHTAHTAHCTSHTVHRTPVPEDTGVPEGQEIKCPSGVQHRGEPRGTRVCLGKNALGCYNLFFLLL